MRRAKDLAASLELFKKAAKHKAKLSPAQYAMRFALETVRQRRRYCDALAVWLACPRPYCRRRRACNGDRSACLRRALARAPRDAQWRARQDILAATPPNIGAPERAARQRLPRDLFE